MDEMSMTSRGGEMTLGGVTFPIHDLKLDFKNMPRIPKTPLSFDGVPFGMTSFGLGKNAFAQETQRRRLIEEHRPKDAVDYFTEGWDARDMVPGNWVRGLYLDYSSPFANCYTVGCGVICARPSHIKPYAEGERGLCVHFLAEGHTGWKAMELRDVWSYG